jgi:hypothetical protein
MRHDGPDRSPGDINPSLEAAWRIREALPQAISIDNFIESHQGDERVVAVWYLPSNQTAATASKCSTYTLRHPGVWRTIWRAEK